MLLGIGPSRQSPLRPLWRYPRHVRHWRLYLAKALFLGWTALLLAGGILLCSLMHAYSLTYFSLWWQPARDMHAEVTAALRSGRCMGGRRHRHSYERWELKLHLPDAPVWNGTMLCSRLRTDSGPIPPGSQLTVQVKSNVWAQAIQIIGQPRPPQQTAP